MTTTISPLAFRTKRKAPRRHSIEFKRDIVQLALQPGACIKHIARDHDISPSLVHGWRQHHREDLAHAQEGAALFAVELTNARPAESTPLSIAKPTSSTAGFMLLNNKQISLRIEGNVDPSLLKLIVEQVLSC